MYFDLPAAIPVGINYFENKIKEMSGRYTFSLLNFIDDSVEKNSRKEMSLRD
jgi:hypothetical protein